MDTSANLVAASYISEVSFWAPLPVIPVPLRAPAPFQGTVPVPLDPLLRLQRHTLHRNLLYTFRIPLQSQSTIICTRRQPARGNVSCGVPPPWNRGPIERPTRAAGKSAAPSSTPPPAYIQNMHSPLPRCFADSNLRIMLPFTSEGA